MARYILAVSGAAVLLFAMLVARHRLRLALNTAEIGLELAIAGVIVILLLFARYYQLPVEPAQRWLAIGFCLYSCISVLNDAVLEHWLTRYVSLWNELGMLTFSLCSLMWACAFWRPVVQPAAAPLYSDNSVYLKMAPEVNLRLRLLNEQLMQFWRLEAPQS